MPVSLKRAVLLASCMVVVLSATALAASPTTVRVGAYHFPPIATVNHLNHAEGLLGDLLAELESVHNDLTFRVVHTSSKRRQLDFQSGLFDVIFFENPRWSWQSEAVQVSEPMLQDQEVYVALNKDTRDQSFFDNVGERRIAGIAGYHYGFAGMETDAETLRKNFDIELSHSHDRNLDLIKADRPSLAEVAVVSRSFLHTYFSRYPDQRETFLVSDKVDQSYQLHVIARQEGPVSIQRIDDLLLPLIESGRYQKMVRQHGLQLPDGMVTSP